MQIRHTHILLILTLLIAGQTLPARAQTDVAASLLGAFSTASNGSSTSQTASSSAGVLLEGRHSFNSALSFELTYSWQPVSESYVSTVQIAGLCSPLPDCLYGPPSVSANAHTFTADWIPEKSTGKFRPFAVLGGGVALFVPTGGQSNTLSATKPVFVFGLGTDWARWKRFGLRVQYRGNLYSAPLLTNQYLALFPSTGSLMLTNEPTLGMYYRWP